MNPANPAMVRRGRVTADFETWWVNRFSAPARISAPDRMNMGAGLSARMSSAIRRHSSVVSSSAVSAVGPAAI